MGTEMDTEARANRLPILVILGATRQGRFGKVVFDWLLRVMHDHPTLEAVPVDLREWQLPYYDHPVGPSQLTPEQEPTEWKKLVAGADGFVVVTPEYNHGYPAVLKSALDAIYFEWNRKPIAFVSYGGWAAGTRAVEQLRLVAIELQMAPVRNAVALQFARALFDESGNPKNPDPLDASARRMLGDLAWWTAALHAARRREA